MDLFIAVSPAHKVGVDTYLQMNTHKHGHETDNRPKEQDGETRRKIREKIRFNQEGIIRNFRKKTE